MSSLPLGKHNAVCIGIIDMGTQKDFNKGFSRKVALLWEVCVDDRKKTMSREYTNSFKQGEPLRSHLESWRGKPFTEAELADFKLCKLLGVPCKIEMRKKNGQKYVGGVYRFPRTEETPKSDTEYIVFDFGDEKTYSNLSRAPEYLIERIIETPEAKAAELWKYGYRRLGLSF